RAPAACLRRSPQNPQRPAEPAAPLPRRLIERKAPAYARYKTRRAPAWQAQSPQGAVTAIAPTAAKRRARGTRRGADTRWPRRTPPRRGGLAQEKRWKYEQHP